MRLFAPILAVTILLVGATALAHSMIKVVSISSGDSFSPSPATFDITFRHRIALADVNLETASGEAIDIGFESVSDMAETFSIGLPPLDSGEFLLTWKAVARDGHIMSDTIDFIVE